VIGGFRSDMSITRKIDGNFGNVSAGVLFSKDPSFSAEWKGEGMGMRSTDQIIT